MSSGHIRRRGTKWAVVVSLGRGANGKYKQRWHSGFATRKDAARALVEINARLQEGTYVAPSKETVAKFLGEWLAATKGSVRLSTFESYELNVRLHIIPALGELRLLDLQPARLNAFYRDLLTSGAARGGSLNPRTVRYVHMILRRALAAAVRWNKLARNPADSSDPPKPGRVREFRTWSAPELKSFLDAIRDDRLYAAWHLAATTGMRRGEVLGLRWSCVQFDEGRVTIRETLLDVGTKITWSTPKTTKGIRSVALDPMTIAVLRDHRVRQVEERLAWGPSYQAANDLVFAMENGEPLHPNRVSWLFRSLVAKSGLPRIRFHDLRHTHATLALTAGVHPKVVSERLGHSTISITLDTYSHAVPAMEQEAAERIARVVFGG